MIYNTSVVVILPYNNRYVRSYVMNKMHSIYRKIAILNNYILRFKVLISHPLVILYLNCTFGGGLVNACLHLMCITTLIMKAIYI